MNIQTKLLILGIFTFLLLECASLSKRPDVATSEDKADKRQEQILQAEKTLLENTNDLMQTFPERTSHLYQLRRERFEKSLKNYLRLTGKQDSPIVILQKEGSKIIIPVYFAGKPPDSNRIMLADSSFVLGETVGKTLHGEVLDMAWIRTDKSDSSYLLLLFADSLVLNKMASPPSDEIEKQIAYRFEQMNLNPVKSIFPSGIIGWGKHGRGSIPDIVVLTSHLKKPRSFQINDGNLVPMKPVESHRQIGDAANWTLLTGENYFKAGNGVLEKFFGLREINNNHYAILDSMGRLVFFDESNSQVLWRSKKAWGNRLFLLNQDRFALCDGRQNKFVVFGKQTHRFSLIGQSPVFAGKVTAVTPAKLAGREGLIVSLLFNDENSLTSSKLQFLPVSLLQYNRPDRYKPPLFPAYNRQLIYVDDNSPDLSYSNSGFALPRPVALNVYETILKRDETGKTTLVLADNIESDSTYTTWTIHLKPDVRFSDGSLLRAEDIIQSWMFLWRKYSGSSDAWLWNDISGITSTAANPQGLEAVDNNTLRIILKIPRPDFIERLVHPKFAIMKPKQNSLFPLGTGAFSVVEVNNRRFPTFIYCSRNNYYHLGFPPLKELTFIFEKSDKNNFLTTQQNAVAPLLRKKNVDYFLAYNPFRVKKFPESVLYYLVLNPNAPALADNRNRMHIVRLFDRSVTAATIADAECRPASGFFEDNELPLKNVSPPPFKKAVRIHYLAGDMISEQIAERLAALLSENGIPFHPPRALPRELFIRVHRNNHFEILVDSFNPVFNQPWLNLALLLNRYSNLGSLSSLVDSLQNTNSMNEYKNVETHFLTKGILYPVLYSQKYFLSAENLKNIQLTGTNGIYFSTAWFPKNILAGASDKFGVRNEAY